jgi:cystathionine gamma-synthase
MQRVETMLQLLPTAFHPSYETISDRIANLIERSPVGPPRKSKVTSKDVYLFPSRISAIYHTHNLLLDWRGIESVVLGFTYELTHKMIETYGPSYKFYSAGTDEALDEF